MRSVIAASLRTYTRRYVAALVAVAVGGAFIVVTSALSSAVRNGLTDGIDEPFAGADLVVDRPATDDALALLDAADERGDEAWVVAWSLQPLAAGDEVVDTSIEVSPLPSEPGRAWQDVSEGRLPDAAGEALVDVHTAASHDITVGEDIRVGTGPDAREATVVGLGSAPAFSAADVWVPLGEFTGWRDQTYVATVAYAAGSYDDAAAAVRATFPDAEVRTPDAWVQEALAEVNSGVDVIRIVLLVFATIALVVAVLVINNTFSILFAQRSREFALLRCVGATRRELVRAIRLESLALGTVAAVVGIAGGIGLGTGAVALIRDQWPDAGLGDPDIGAGWALAAAVVCVVATVVAAWLPTRRAVRTAPLAALRPDDSTSVRTAPGRIRTALSVLAIVAGAACLAVAMAAAVLPAMLLGGVLTFAGVVGLGPLVVPLLTRGLGRLTGLVVGPAGRMAAGNAVRNPRRTAATTASLLIGVTLTTAVLTGMASARTALDDMMDTDHPLDAAVTAPAPLDADVTERIAALPDVATAVPVAGAEARIEGVGPLPVVAMPEDAPVRGTAFTTPADDRIRLPWSAFEGGLSEGDRVAVSVGGTTLELRVAGGAGWGEAGLVAPAVLERLAPDAPQLAVWVRATDDADPDAFASDLAAVADPLDAEVEDGLSRRDYVDLQLDVLTGGVVGLLGIAVVIALVGIASTLGLSVLERGREHALLRAVGLTRRQLRAMLGTEAVLLATVASGLGIALGVAYAWVGVRTMVEPAVPDAAVVLPVGQLALILAVCVVAGLLACLLPARRAARIPPAAGLALD